MAGTKEYSWITRSWETDPTLQGGYRWELLLLDLVRIEMTH